MAQNVDDVVWKLYEKALDEDAKERIHKAQVRVQNSKRVNTGSWTDKVVSSVKISDIANENGINSCPLCGYDLQFDDGRGWFICCNNKYSQGRKCSFGGNIVDFVAETGAVV
ncbi:MAG: hypothetical protein ACTSPI_12310 [Candidatus Heimdallarchaeaceae archaeon]